MAALLLLSSCGVNGNGEGDLYSSFKNPGNEAKPWCFWYWIYGAVSKEGIQKDLIAMKHAGLEGFYLMPIKDSTRNNSYHGKYTQLTPEWWDMVNYSIHEADSLGLKMGIHICDGFALAGGPWIKPEESMQKVVWSDTVISSKGKPMQIVLPETEKYKGYSQDIKIYAFPWRKSCKPVFKITYSSLVSYDGSYYRAKATAVRKAERTRKDPAWIQYEYSKPYTCKSIGIDFKGFCYQANRFKILVSNDGKYFKKAEQLNSPRTGWQSYTHNYTHSIKPVTAKYFRFVWSPEGSEPGSEDLDAAKWKPNLKVRNIKLYNRSYINEYEGKSGIVWRVARETRENEVAPEDCIRKDNMLDVTDSFDGRELEVSLPKGVWKIIRFAHTSTGTVNSTGGGGLGLECDKLSASATKKQLDNWFASFYKKTDSKIARRVITNMHVDSWECGGQDWGEAFAAEFKKRRGYDLLPYMPLYAGYVIGSAKESEKVLRDIRTTISDLVVDVFYQTVSEYSKEYNCKLSEECDAPMVACDGMQHYKKADLPMGEFWYNSPTHKKPNDVLDAVSAAHIYGKNIVQAEGFTEIRGSWREDPDLMKPLLDRNFALGINRLYYHVFAHNPWTDRKPGMTLDGIGFYFQRDQTWWKYGAPAFSDYISRCQTLLQYGDPVVDIAVFTGDEIPRRAILPNRLISSLPGIIGEKRIKEEKKRLENEGQPVMKTMGVSHSSNIADYSKWTDALHGYKYDSFNPDALIGSHIEDGELVLSSGMHYKMLVLPGSRPMNPDDIISQKSYDKISSLRKAGLIVPEVPYTSADFSSLGIKKDVIVPENICWTHRHGKDYDIYFIGNQEDITRRIKVSVRASIPYAELWNPVDGRRTLPDSIYAEKGRTCFDFFLSPHQSIFIVGSCGTETLPNVNFVSDTSEINFAEKWKIYFKNIDSSIVSEKLFDWSKAEDLRIKYYSGSAVYNSSFDYNGENSNVYIKFDSIFNVAAVDINGINCGTIWTTPYLLDIGKALKEGRNTIKIHVANTWVNAIYGMDRGVPPFKGIWTNAKYRSADTSLSHSGVLGNIYLIDKKTK